MSVTLTLTQIRRRIKTAHAKGRLTRGTYFDKDTTLRCGVGWLFTRKEANAIQNRDSGGAYMMAHALVTSGRIKIEGCTVDAGAEWLQRVQRAVDDCNCVTGKPLPDYLYKVNVLPALALEPRC